MNNKIKDADTFLKVLEELEEEYNKQDKNGTIVIAGSNGVYIYKNIDDFLKVMAELEKQYDEKRRFKLCNLPKL